MKSLSMSWERNLTLCALCVTGVTMLIASAMCVFGEWASGVFLDLGCGLIVGIVIYLLLERVVGEKMRQMELFRSLIHDLHSNESLVRDMAVEDMSEHGWWKGADLHLANLSGVTLPGKDFGGADLRRANLFGISLIGANLQGCNFQYANLQGALLMKADLRNADLRKVELGGAFLSEADLRGAKYDKKDLEGATIDGIVVS